MSTGEIPAEEPQGYLKTNTLILNFDYSILVI